MVARGIWRQVKLDGFVTLQLEIDGRLVRQDDVAVLSPRNV